MEEEESLATIRRTLSHVPVHRIELVDDPDFGRIAKVYVADCNLSAALGENGEHAKRAAMTSGIAVGIVLDQS